MYSKHELAEKEKKQVFYSANKECAIYIELASIIDKIPDSKSGGSELKLDNPLLMKYRDQILKLAEGNGITNVRVFGSFARNEQGPESDLDLLVELQPGSTGLDLGGFLMDVSELMKRKVDVVTDKALHPKIREQVLHEAIVL